MTAFNTEQVASSKSLGFRNRNLIILIVAQGILGAQLPMMTILAGLIGMALAPNLLWATFPVTAQAVGSMLSSIWLSKLMQQHGRRNGFLVGVAGGAVGAIICVLALLADNFYIFVSGSFLTGIYMAAQGFYRFAAMDAVAEPHKPKAVSLVISGGLFAAIFGPQLLKATIDATAVTYLGTYVAVIVINLAGALMFINLDLGGKTALSRNSNAGRSRLQLLQDPKILRAIGCAAVSYGLMILVMTSVPLAMVGIGNTPGMAADIISVHILAMFLPSFFAGHLISRFGAEPIVLIGLCLLGAAGIADLSGMSFHHFLVGLILLGVGWNFSFIGATAMLSQAHNEAEKGDAQGLNDMFVFASMAIASSSSGALLLCRPTIVEGWQTVNLMMIPFLILCGGLIITPSVINIVKRNLTGFVEKPGEI